MTRFLLLCFWLLAGTLEAQMMPSRRLEIMRDEKKSEDFEVLSLGKQGVLITKTVDDPFRGIAHLYHFSRYDSTLAPRWETEFQLKYPFEGLLSYHTDEQLYWLCGDPHSDKIQIWKINLETGDTEMIDGEVLAIDEVSKFKVLGNKAFLAGTYNDRPVVVAFSFFDKSSKALPELYDSHLSINELDVDERSNQIHVFSRLTRKGKCQLQLQSYDYDGRLLHKTMLSDESGNSLITAKIVRLKTGESLLVGNYSLNCSDYSQGLYLTKLNGSESDAIRYVPFHELQNFFNYLKPSRQERLKNRIAEQQKRGKDPKFHYLLQIHDPVPTDDGYLLVAEAYFPQAKTTASTTPFVVSRPRRSSYDSYRYTHALVCGLDASGSFVWDNSMDLKDLTTDVLGPQVQLSSEGDTLRLTYSHENKVRAVQIQGSKTLGKPQEYELFSEELKKNMDRDTYPSLASWYGPYFLSWGYRKFPATAQQPTREAFFVYRLEHPRVVEE
ncbi:hypothetical protein [Siphonobacter sp.]|uniref:hypothetical protein n=1 Tax=Siphonobacter sp. TaxID=1869184 RepID=UPI003B3A7532